MGPADPTRRSAARKDYRTVVRRTQRALKRDHGNTRGRPRKKDKELLGAQSAAVVVTDTGIQIDRLKV